MEQITNTSFDLDKGGKIFIYASTAICVAMIFVAGSAMSFAMMTALLGTVSVMYLLFQARMSGKTGAKFWNWCMEHATIVDLAMAVAFGYMFGITTATGLLAAGAAGVMNSAILNFIHDYTPNHGLVDLSKFGPEPEKQDSILANFNVLSIAS